MDVLLISTIKAGVPAKGVTNMIQYRYEEKDADIMKIVLKAMKNFKTNKEITIILKRKKIKIHPKKLTRIKKRLKETWLVDEPTKFKIYKISKGYSTSSETWFYCRY